MLAQRSNGGPMIDPILLSVITVGVLGYLLYSLLFPERF
ncbi:MAG: K(+)-transporting ATPase subunit F [Deltaproteobacteria bacterium]|nr:K(+)-transporting ATPase subunit F [Deltaproteobacteria bacterium]